jgi:hypothetical protein
MVWGLEEAKKSAIVIDEKKLDEWDQWSLAGAAANGVEGMGQMITARRRPNADEKTIAALVKLGDTITAQQKPDGFWEPGGQLPGQKRPKRETTEVSTMWTILALADLEERTKPNEKFNKSRAKALKWLKEAKDNKPGVSNEWHAVRLIVEHRFGEANRVEEQFKDLLAAQQVDGGWAWLRGDTSDALATGQVLYALSVLGKANTDPVVQRAWKFLADTQSKDGSWQVKGTKENTKTKPQATSNYWGTAWATIGLSRSLNNSPKAAK